MFSAVYSFVLFCMLKKEELPVRKRNSASLPSTLLKTPCALEFLQCFISFDLQPFEFRNSATITFILKMRKLVFSKVEWLLGYEVSTPGISLGSFDHKCSELPTTHTPQAHLCYFSWALLCFLPPCFPSYSLEVKVENSVVDFKKCWENYGFLTIQAAPGNTYPPAIKRCSPHPC